MLMDLLARGRCGVQVLARYDALAGAPARASSSRAASGPAPSSELSAAEGAIGFGVEMPEASSASLPGLQ
jgi:hypothetical protein